MKIARNGKARSFPPDQIELMMTDLFQDFRDRALFQICYSCAARIGEVCKLRLEDVDPGQRKILFRAANTKQKKTRMVPITVSAFDRIEQYLQVREPVDSEYLFPGRWRGHLCPKSASKILKAYFDMAGIVGASTHSFRRSAITNLHAANVPIRVITSITGQSLTTVQGYIDITETQILEAIAKI